jgi:hypothetical protein
MLPARRDQASLGRRSLSLSIRTTPPSPVSGIIPNSGP